MKLLEIRSTVQWEWDTSDKDIILAMFSIGDLHYHVAFQSAHMPEYEGPTQDWDVEFAVQDESGDFTQELTGTGSSPTVFAAIIQIVREFIQNYNPRSLGFSAIEPERFKLYSRLLGMLEKAGWDVDEHESGGDRIYTAHRPDWR